MRKVNRSHFTKQIYYGLSRDFLDYRETIENLVFNLERGTKDEEGYLYEVIRLLQEKGCNLADKLLDNPNIILEDKIRELLKR
jgi:hypothetical protein